MGDKVIGVDIGGTNIRVGLINSNLKLLRKETVLTSNFQNTNEFFEQIRTMIETIDVNREAIKIGMALPVLWKDGMKKFSDITNLPFLEGTSVSEF